MNLLKIGNHRINADHIALIRADDLGPDDDPRAIVWGDGINNGIAVLTGEDARALLAWWDARADNVLQEYQRDR